MSRVVLAVSLGVFSLVAAGLAGGARPETRSAPLPIAASELQLPQLLGFVDGSLARIDPETLRPRPGKRIPVGSGGCAARQGGTACWAVPPWAISPDAARLAVARNLSSSIRVVDARRMRVTADIRVGGGALGAVAWLAGGRLLALQEAGSERQRLVAVDLASKRLVARRALGGAVMQVARTPRELLMVVAPAQAIGRARIAVADRRGVVRFAALERILAGSKLLGTGSDHRVDSRTPGLAVDPEGRRAYVVGQDLVAEVDLRSLAVSYRSLARPRSLFARLRNWLEPVADAKQVSGYSRMARWLGGGLLAVSGADTEQGTTRAAGLQVVDTQRWNVRTIDRAASHVVVAGDLLLTTGTAVTAYSFDGERRFRLFDGGNAWVALVHSGRAYVGVSGDRPLRIVDLSSGRVIGERDTPLPWLVRGAAAGWWAP